MATFKQLLDQDKRENLIDSDQELLLRSLISGKDMADLVRDYDKLTDGLAMDYSFSSYLKDVVLADHEFASKQPEAKLKQRITISEEKMLKREKSPQITLP